MVQEMTHGKPIKLIIMFTIPVMIGNIFQQLYNMVDAIVVGQFVGVNALAGIGVASSLSFMILGFSIGSCNGFCVVLAQRFGAQDERGLRSSVTTSIYLAIVFAVVVTIISLLTTKPLLELISTPDEAIGYALNFLMILYSGLFAQMAFNLFSSILRALGDSRTSLYFLVIASILNLILNLVTVVGLGWGVVGSGISTVVSQFVSSVLCVIYMFKKYPILRPKREDWKINLPYSLLHLKIGLPMGLQYAITAVGFLILQSAINHLGSNVVAGFTASNRIENLVVAVFLALSAGVATYTAQNYGAGHYDRIRSGARAASLIGISLCAIIVILLLIFWEPLIFLFVGDSQPEVTEAARQYLFIAIPNYFVLSLLLIFRNLIQSIGRTIVPMFAGAAELVMRAVGAIVLANMFGYIGICWSPVCAWYAAFSLLIIFYFYYMRKLKRSPEKLTNG